MVVWYIYTRTFILGGELNNKKESTRQLHIRLPGDMYKKLKVKCVHDDISMQDYVSLLITASLDGFSKERYIGKQSKTISKAKK